MRPFNCAAGTPQPGALCPCAHKATTFLPVRYRVRTVASGSNPVVETGESDNIIIESPLQWPWACSNMRASIEVHHRFIMWFITKKEVISHPKCDFDNGRKGQPDRQSVGLRIAYTMLIAASDKNGIPPLMDEVSQQLRKRMCQQCATSVVARVFSRVAHLGSGALGMLARVWTEVDGL